MELLKVFSVTLIPEHWGAFQALARSEGSTGSALLRQLMRRELRRAGVLVKAKGKRG